MVLQKTTIRVIMYQIYKNKGDLFMAKSDNKLKTKRKSGIVLNGESWTWKALVGAFGASAAITIALTFFPHIFGNFAGLGFTGGGLGAINSIKDVAFAVANGVAYGGGALIASNAIYRGVVHGVQLHRYKKKMKSVGLYDVEINGEKYEAEKSTDNIDQAILDYRKTETLINSILLPEITKHRSTNISLIDRIKSYRADIDWRKAGNPKISWFRKIGVREKAILEEDYVKSVIRHLVKRLERITSNRHRTHFSKGNGATGWTKRDNHGNIVPMTNEEIDLANHEARAIQAFLHCVINKCEVSDPFVKTLIRAVKKAGKNIDLVDPDTAYFFAVDEDGKYISDEEGRLTIETKPVSSPALYDATNQLINAGNVKAAVYNLYGTYGITADATESTAGHRGNIAADSAEAAARRARKAAKDAEGTLGNIRSLEAEAESILTRLRAKCDTFDNDFKAFLRTLKAQFDTTTSPLVEQFKSIMSKADLDQQAINRYRQEIEKFIKSEDYTKLTTLKTTLETAYQNLNNLYLQIKAEHDAYKKATGKTEERFEKIEKTLDRLRDFKAWVNESITKLRQETRKNTSAIEQLRQDIATHRSTIDTMISGVNNNQQIQFETLIGTIKSLTDMFAKGNQETRKSIKEVGERVTKLFIALHNQAKAQNAVGKRVNVVEGRLMISDSDIEALQLVLTSFEGILGRNYQACLNEINGIKEEQEKQKKSINGIYQKIKEIRADYKERTKSLNSRAQRIEQLIKKRSRKNKEELDTLAQQIIDLENKEQYDYTFLVKYIEILAKLIDKNTARYLAQQGELGSISKDVESILRSLIAHTVAEISLQGQIDALDNKFTKIAEINKAKITRIISILQSTRSLLGDKYDELLEIATGLNAEIESLNKKHTELAEEQKRLKDEQAVLAARKSFPEPDKEQKKLRDRFEDFAISIYNGTPIHQAPSSKASITRGVKRKIGGAPVKLAGINYNNIQNSDIFRTFLQDHLTASEYDKVDELLQTSYKNLTKEDLEIVVTLIKKAYEKVYGTTTPPAGSGGTTI